jgi:K+-sensing histidine kinase KdpD
VWIQDRVCTQVHFSVVVYIYIYIYIYIYMDFWTLRHGYTRIVVFLLNIISMIGHMSYKYGYSSLLISIYIYNCFVLFADRSNLGRTVTRLQQTITLFISNSTL